jgi:hypothetical protein
LDLSLDDAKNEVDNISTIIRPMLSKNIGKDFGTYGIVLWTKHDSWVEEFKKRIQKDSDRYTLPLFVIALDKTKYHRDGYELLFTDLDVKLNENVAASFFITWSMLVSHGRDEAITNIYSLVDDYEKQDSNLQFLLFHLAKNYTGIPFDYIKNYSFLHIDAFKAFNDMMNYEIIRNDNVDCRLFESFPDIHYQGNDFYYKEIWPLEIDESGKNKMIIFDFRYFGFIEESKLKDVKKNKLLFRAKDKLFADILQKLSSHAARLGLSILHS